MRRSSWVAALVITSTPATALAFNIIEYCRQVASAAGGSYQIEEVCRQEEQSAWAEVTRSTAPERIKDYCNQIADAAGGSYQIMRTCIAEEKNSKIKLENSTPSTDFKTYYKFRTPEYGEVAISVKQDSFEKLGQAETFWMLTKYSKPKYHTSWSSGKEEKKAYYSELEYKAVICNTTENNKTSRMLYSGAALLAYTYFDKNGNPIHRNDYKDKYQKVKTYEIVKNGVQEDPFNPTLEGTWGGLNYRIACEGGK